MREAERDSLHYLSDSYEHRIICILSDACDNHVNIQVRKVECKKMKIKAHNANTYATSPGSVSISDEKLKMLRPDLYGFVALLRSIIRTICLGYSEKRQIEEHLLFGDCQPAIVMSKQPLTVAAYSEDIDCVVLLRFPDKYAELYNLDNKSKLITINTYGKEENFQKDITTGEHCDYTWTLVNPFIAEFLTDDLSLLEEKKEQIDNKLWDYVYNLAVEYQILHPKVWRDGRPNYSAIPASWQDSSQ